VLTAGNVNVDNIYCTQRVVIYYFSISSPA